MGKPEHISPQSDSVSAEWNPQHLPLELLDYLRRHERVLVTQRVDQKTAYVLKAPSNDLSELCEDGLITLQHEFYNHPRAPVIRTVFDLYTREENVMSFELFYDIHDRDQRCQIADLIQQDALDIMLYDDHVVYRDTVSIDNTVGLALRDISEQAAERAHMIPFHRYDFERAVYDVTASTSLGRGKNMVVDVVDF